MGTCKYCGRSAGLLRRKHAECETRYLQGCSKITQEVVDVINNPQNMTVFLNTIEIIEHSCLIPSSERNQHLIEGWRQAVENYLADGCLDSGEGDRLEQFLKIFHFDLDALDAGGAMTKAAKYMTLFELSSGKIPQRCAMTGSLPIIFRNEERVVWIFSDAAYLKDKLRIKMVGSSSAASVRIGKGNYLENGCFEGKQIEYIDRSYADKGWLVLTEQNLYFTGQKENLRIPHSELLTMEPRSDGVILTRDAESALPQIFITGDGWFTYNLLLALAQFKARPAEHRAMS